MKIRKAAIDSVAGALALTALPMAAHAQQVTMGINMTLTSLASASSTNLNFGNLSANPTGGNITMSVAAGSSVGTVSGSGVLGGSVTATAGIISFTRNVAVKATLTPPVAVTMSCPGGVVSVGSFTTATISADCTSSAATTCGYAIGGTATLPASLTTGSCTAGTATFTITYS